jgi:hypothetical protein
MTVRSRMSALSVIAVALLIAVSIPAGAQPAGAQQAINPADFRAEITHPLFPLSLTGPKVFAGQEKDDKGKTITTRFESHLLDTTEVLLGVKVVVLEETAYKDGELVERALDYFAQHSDGSVYYFGEKVDNFEGGKLKDHHGQWIAGEGNNRPGVIMGPNPAVGQTFEQEFAPGIAEDKSTVLSTTESVTTPAGTYSNCMKTKDFTPLEPGIEEFKWFCPNIGLAQDPGSEKSSKLTSIGPARQVTAPPAAPPAAAAPKPAPARVPSAGSGGTTASGASGEIALAVVAMLIAGSAFVAVAVWRRAP